MNRFQRCGNNLKWCFEYTSYKLDPLDGTKVMFSRHPLIVMFTNSCSHSEKMLVPFLHYPKFFHVVWMSCILVLWVAHLLQFSLPSQDVRRLKKYNFKTSRIVTSAPFSGWWFNCLHGFLTGAHRVPRDEVFSPIVLPTCSVSVQSGFQAYRWLQG